MKILQLVIVFVALLPAIPSFSEVPIKSKSELGTIDGATLQSPVATMKAKSDLRISDWSLGYFEYSKSREAWLMQDEKDEMSPVCWHTHFAGKPARPFYFASGSRMGDGCLNEAVLLTDTDKAIVVYIPCSTLTGFAEIENIVGELKIPKNFRLISANCEKGWPLAKVPSH